MRMHDLYQLLDNVKTSMTWVPSLLFEATRLSRAAMSVQPLLRNPSGSIFPH